MIEEKKGIEITLIIVIQIVFSLIKWETFERVFPVELSCINSKIFLRRCSMSTKTIFKPEQLKAFNFPVEREESLNSQGFDTGFDNVFNASTGVNLGVVSREYKLVTHKEAIFNVVDTFKKNGLPGIEPVNVRMSGGGARMYAEFRFKQEMELGIHSMEDPKVGDVIAPGFKITNSYDRSVKYEISAYILD